MKILKTYEKFIRKENLNDIYQKYYSAIPFDVFKKIIKSDPTSLIDGQLYLGKYCKWLLKLYTSDNLKLEDLYKVPEYLQLFDKQLVRNKLPLEKRNINNFKSLGELAQTISEFKPEDLMSKKEIKEDNLVEEFENYKLYIPKDFKDSCILGKGTEWCTATEKTDRWFKTYHKPGRELLIFISKDNPKDKYQFHFRTEQFMDRNDRDIDIKDFLQENPDIDSWLKLNVKDYKRMNSKSIKLVYQSNFNDYPKIIEGDFDCSHKRLTSLIGCPEIIEGYFSCRNNNLTDLKGCPKIIEGDFYCGENDLTSLEGCPEKIEGGFDCSQSYLTDLIGCANIIEGLFSCSHNQLTSLKGCAEKIEGSIYCRFNQLTSLKGCPEIIEGHFNCSNNKLTSLIGCSKIIEGDFNCYGNKLTSLEGYPEIIEGHFNCSHNQLTSLEGCPEIINGDFYCYENLLTSLEGCPEKIPGDFSCSNNKLTSLKGCPKIIEGDFMCYENPRLTDKDFEWLEKNCKIGGQILI
jgi:hypothetical protein